MMRKFLLLFLLLFSVHALQAATFYFSSVSGDDSRSPLEAQNPATPWKSLDRFNSYMRFLQPGDSILFKRGEVFYGTMMAKAKGSLAGTIYYGAWGTGANPVFSGFTTVTGWAQYSPGIYSAPLEASYPNIITINGEPKAMGRWPNTGYLKYEGANGNQSITDNELPASPNWTGAEVVIRKYRFILDRHPITAHTGGTLTYATSTVNGNNSSFSPVKNNGYFIQNHLGTLDQFGEWYYDTAAKRIFVFFGNNAPSNYVVKASTKDFNIVVSTAYFLKFENLDFEGASQKGLYLINTSYTTVQNCHFYNQGGISLYGIDLNSVNVYGCTINNSFSNGITFEYNANNCTIDGVSVTNTNILAGTARSGSGSGIGISAAGENINITNNRVVNTGYNGIQFIGNNVLVEHNYVDSFCTVKDDGGGIYTYTGSVNDSNYNRRIRNNIVLNAIGAREGTDAYYYEPYGKAAGIYLDEYANGLEISDNTIANGDWAGIFLHYAHADLIKENLVFNHRYQVYVSQSSPATRNLTVTDNQFVAKQSSQATFYYLTSVYDTPATMGLFNYNAYARPMAEGATIQLDKFYTGGGGTFYVSLAQWRSAYGLDSASQTSPLTFSSNVDDNIRFEYNAMSSPKNISLNASYLDAANKPYAGTLTLAPFTGAVLLKSTVTTKALQTINFPALANKTDGDAPFDINATASSGLPVSFRVLSGPATISGNKVTVTGTGPVSIKAFQAGSGSYAAATDVVQSFTVAPNPATPPPAKQSQTISFAALDSTTWGTPTFNLMATASSGLPVVYRVVSGKAAITNRTVTIYGTGIISIEASQPGDATYNAAAPVVQSFGVGKSNQTITFPAIPDKVFGDAPFDLLATASSSQPVDYRVVSGPATVSGSRITLTGTGTVTIEATQAGDTLTNPAVPVQRRFTVSTGSSGGKLAQSISFGVLANKIYGDAPFAINAVASSGLPVSLRVTAGPATLSGNTVTLTGTGTVTIEASQAGNATYDAAPVVAQSFTITKAAQVISFGPLANKTYGDAPFALNATASSGLPVSYRVVSGLATLSGNTVTLTGTGTVTIEASQNGDGNFNAAPSIVQSFTVSSTSITKQAQTISFGTLAYKNYGNPPFVLTATASSGLPVSYRVVSGPVTISGSTVTITGVGTVSIEASQAGDATYNAATPVIRSFTIGKANQSITFPTPPNKVYGDAPFALTASASSGLPVSYRVVSGQAAVSGNIVTLTGIGTVTMEASQAGDNLTNAAYPLQRSFTVSTGSTMSKQTQTITFEPLANKTYGDPSFTVNATTSSGLPVSFRIVSGPATVSGNTVTITGAGVVTVEASQTGNTNYGAASPVQQSFTVAKASQTISFAAIPSKTYGDSPFTLNAMASSGLPISFRVVSGPATISGNTVSLTGIGTVNIEASQGGNANYNAAAVVTQSFTVQSPSTTTKQAQTISFGTLAYKTYTSPPFELMATASSGLPVSYCVVSGPITISGNIVTITGVGTVTIEASQAGDASYNAATPVQRSFTIGKAGQSLSFSTPSNKVYGDPPFALTATTTSGLPVQYRVVSGPATVSGNTVTLTGTGTVTIEASQPGNAYYSAAYPLNRSFTVMAGNNTAPTTMRVQERRMEGPIANNEVQLTVYPNPVHGQGIIRVQVPRTMQGELVLYSMDGKKVKAFGNRQFEKGHSQLITFSTQGLVNGTYILRLVTKEAIFHQVFQVQ
jgi:hypothetical protein